VSADADETTLCIIIADEGPGIAEQELPHIFTPFFTRKSQGTGLCLAVVKTVINAHQGDIRVASSASGTTFRIELPRYHGVRSEPAVAAIKESGD